MEHESSYEMALLYATIVLNQLLATLLRSRFGNLGVPHDCIRRTVFAAHRSCRACTDELTQRNDKDAGCLGNNGAVYRDPRWNSDVGSRYVRDCREHLQAS